VVWLLAEVNMISPALEHISWGVCDWVAKVNIEHHAISHELQHFHKRQCFATRDHS
jgi:hypothetical protein